MPKGNSRYDAEHLRNISAYQRQIDEIFKAADEEAARIAKASGAEYDPDRPFSFDDYPSVRKRVDKMTSDLSSRVERTIVNGIKAQWELSNRKNDDLVETVTGLKADDFPSDQRRRWFGTNEPARDAFIRRETEGMNLSEEVWRFKKETEFGIDLSLKGMQDRMERGLSEGVSAADMSRELRGYLKNPDKLFRRVRDERGNLTLSRNARLFHPGRGVYRSSYMNARRLAATETNMAYRSADHERWKSLDFVVGIEISTSNNHTTKDSKGKPQPLEDICDILAGRYPKDFKFVGWHPHCRCIATTILKTEEEMEADTERILNGEEPLSPDTSRNFIGELPEKFTKWLDKNAERIENAKSLPYFLADNQGLINGATANAGSGGGGNTLSTGGGGGGEPPVNNNGGGGGGFGGETPKTLQHLDESISNYKFTDKNLKDREAEVNSCMKKLIDSSDFGLQIKGEYFDNVLEDGEFKNQFQTGHSGGAIDSTITSGPIDSWNKRLTISHLMFGGKGETSEFGRTPIGEYGYMGKQWERSDYEKYGCLLEKNRVTSYNTPLLRHYGDIQVRFKKDMVRDRCTFTFDDSLDILDEGKWFQPTLVSDPHVESFDLEIRRSADDFINKSNWENIAEWKKQNHTGYVELQFHGKLPTEYIKDVTFPSDPRTDDVWMKRAEKCKSKGIEVWYIDGDKAVRY